jgi:ABC-type antimicrobial peptide transport system permease subunit
MNNNIIQSIKILFLNKTYSVLNIAGLEGRVGGRLRQGTYGDFAEIIGVVKNFVFNNMSGAKQEPLILWYNPNRTNHQFIRLNTGDTQAALSRVGAVMKEFDPNRPFDYRFMEDSFNQLFQSEQFTGKLALLFAALAIFISCLGLFGLTAFAAEQRTREIGIRKVLGASVWSILKLLGRNFLFLILVSFVIALPVAWWLVHQWLNVFEYRVNVSWMDFATACLLVVCIVMITVSVQSLKAATANPVKAIKSE